MTVALLLLLVLYSCSLFVKRDELAPFDLKHTLPLRGILALLVILGHLDTVVSSQTKLLMPFHMATPAVAVFFFMSGYGLMLSYTKKGERYLNGFVTKSAIKLLIPLVITSCLYQFALYVKGDFDLNRMIEQYVDGSETALVHSWYVYALFLFYILYYLVFQFVKKGKCLCMFGLMTIYYMITRYCFDWDFFWWMTCMAFPMGLLYSQYEAKIKEYIKGRYWIAIPMLIGLLVVKFISGDYTLICAELPYIFLGPLVAVLMYKLPLPTESKILNFLGTLSFEIYLTHGAFEQLLKNAFASPYLYIIVVVASTILTSWLLHNVYSKITSPLLAKVK